MNGMVPVARLERKYMICPTGRIWNLEKQAWQTQSMNPNGYMKVQLNLNGTHQFLIHQLIALHFLPNPYKHPQVNHLDGDKTNNTVSNLQWCNGSENIQHALELGLRKGFLSKQEKAVLIQRVLKGELIKNLAKEIGRGQESLSGMLRKHTDSLGLRQEWNLEMQRRRKDVAIRNLEKINS